MGRPPVKLTPVYDISINWAYYERHQVPMANAQGCTHWDAGRHRQGYGMTHAKRHSDDEAIMVTTHRVAARLKYKRAISSNELVIHTCSNMACMNPDHLIIGTRQDMKDIMTLNNRHRWGTPTGRPSVEEMAAALTTPELIELNQLTRIQIAAVYGYSANKAKYFKRAVGKEIKKRYP